MSALELNKAGETHKDVPTAPEETTPSSITKQTKVEAIDLTNEEAYSSTDAHTISLNSSIASADTLNKSISNPSCADLEETRPVMSDKNFKMNQTQNTFSGSIPRPPNSFILYRREKRHDIVKQAEDSQAVSNSMVSKMAAEMWKREAPEVKAKYIAQAEELRKSHRLKFPDFKYSTKEKSQQAIQRNMASASQPMRPMMYYNPRFVEQPAKRDHHWNTMSPVSPVSPHSFTPPMTPAMDPRSNPYYTQPWPRQEHIRYAQPIYAPRQVSMRPPQLTQQSVYSQPRVYAANQYPPGHSYSPSSPTAPMYVYAPPEPQQTHPSHRTHKHYNAYHPYAHPPPIPDPYLSYRRY